MDDNPHLSLVLDLLEQDQLDHDVLYFEPFKSHLMKDAIKILVEECSIDMRKKEIFKYNIRELFKNHYRTMNVLYDGVLKPNTALLEHITMTVFNDTESRYYAELRKRFPRLADHEKFIERTVEWTKEGLQDLKEAKFVERWLKEYPSPVDVDKELVGKVHEHCYAIMHVASYILDEQELKQIEQVLPHTAQKSLRRIVLDYEIALLRFKNLLISDATSVMSLQSLMEIRIILTKMVDEFNEGYHEIHDPEMRNACISAAEVLIQCFWILVSKFALDDNNADRLMIKSLGTVESPQVLSQMMYFWIKFPSRITSLYDRRLYHQTLVEWIVPYYTMIDQTLIDCLIEEQRLGQSGVLTKTFVLYHALRIGTSDFGKLILNFTDADNFPSPHHPDAAFTNSLMRERKHEQFSVEQFESMWDSIIVTSTWRGNSDRSVVEKIIVRGMISDLESLILSDFKRMTELAQQYLDVFESLESYRTLIEIIRKRVVTDANAAGIQDKGYKLIANLQLQHFAHFVNLTPVETEDCFVLILDILDLIPEFENSRTPYEVISLCFQNACLHRSLELRNFLAERIAYVLEGMHNYHAMNHFLLSLAKVLRSNSSEDLMRNGIKGHRKDPLMIGIENTLRDLEKTMNEFNYHELEMLDSHLQPTHNGINNILEHRCQVHLTCLCILTFCDQTHVFSPLQIWFESILRIVKLGKKLKKERKISDMVEAYSELLTKHILTNSVTFPAPQGQLLETIRDTTPLFFMMCIVDEKKAEEYVTKLCNSSFVHLLDEDLSLLELLPDSQSLMSVYLIDRLNTVIDNGLLIPQLVHTTIKCFDNAHIHRNYINFLNSATQLAWFGAVQHEDLEYIANVTGSHRMSINVYLQFKVRDELDGTERITLTVGDLVVTFTCSSNVESLRCFYSTTYGEQFIDFETPPYKVHTMMFQIKNVGEEVVIITSDKVHKVLHLGRQRPVDEVKVSVTSLHHTIPVIFQGDRQSLHDVHEMSISSKNIEQARRFALVTKGRKLNIGQMFHSVIPVRNNYTITFKKELSGFENTMEQLRAAGGFGFIFHSFSKMLLDNEHHTEELLISHWKLLLSYLASPYLSNEKFSRVEAIQTTSLLFRYGINGVPEVIVQEIFNKCMMANQEITEAFLLTEILSESSFWENDLPMFYRLLIRFRSTHPGSNLDKCLPLILHIVAKIIRKDRGTDEVHDIVTVTIEIFKEWCREPHVVKTAHLVTFMMDLFDFEKISPQFDKFRWIDECVLERELARQPCLVINGDDVEEQLPKRSNVDLLQMDLPIGPFDDDELFRVLTPSDEPPIERDFRMMVRNKDYMMKGLLQILHQSYVLCPDSQYSCFDSITAEKICYLLEVNNDGKVVGLLIEMYEAIINHNIYSDKITKIYQHNLLLILARQLRNKSLTMQSVNALFSILLREQVDVSAGLDTSHLEAFSPNAISCQAMYPLLTVLEESVDDVDIAVFTVVCTSLNKVYIYNNQLTQVMTVAGIDEHMVAILLKLARIGDFRIRNEKLKALLDPWFAFAISIMRVGVNGKKSLFEGTSRLISHLLLLYTQENGKLMDNPENEAQRLLRDNIYWTLVVLLLQLFKFLLDIALADSNKHRSASNSSLHMMGYDEDPEEIEAAPPKPTKFWDEIAQKVKESVLGPNHNFMKCPYRKHKESPLTAEEIRHRIKDVLTLCQYFFKLTTRLDYDEEDTLYKIFFEELSKWTLDEAWPNCIWVAADMMFVTNVFANCVTFVMTDIHQYMTPFKKVFNRQKSIRLEILLQKIVKSYQKISTVFGNVMDIDQMIRLTMENITQREDHNSTLFKLAVSFLNSPSRERGKGHFEYPHPRTPDLIQRLTVESEIASRYWLDQRNEVIEKINLKGRMPQPHCDTSTINYSLEKMEKTLAAPRNMKRVNEVCELMVKLRDNERVFSRLELIKNNHGPRKITTILGPRGERMITDMTDIKSEEMFAKQANAKKTSMFRNLYDMLSLSRFRKPDVFSTARNSCLHGILSANGVQTNPIFHVHRSGITALPCGSHITEKTYLFEEMTMIFKRPMRPWDALEVSFEILLKTHETILIFSQQRFAKLLTQYAGKLIANTDHLLTLAKQWEEGKTSNFDYLMMLNLFAGRTFHDSSNYPIFPRIISKFGQDTIDLLDKSLYRKLDRPVAAQDNIAVEKHKQHYHELKENEGTSHLTPYHFGSMCSNRGVVSFYNIRLLPFGEEAIELQDGRFDFPDRLFHNIEAGLGLGKVESSNDYKELVPELFTTVEVLRNENRNLFGEKQSGESVNDVQVPGWCYVNGKPVHEHFIYAHRQALESENVQAMLHNWIDLVFGCKSRGKAAHDAINVYHPAVYPGSSPPPSFDRVMINAYEANQKTLGTAPQQLFTQPHPKREVVTSRHGSVRNIHGLSFGKELTVGEYEVSEDVINRHAPQRVWKKMKILKARIFNYGERIVEPEMLQLFRRNRDKKEKDPAAVNVKINENILKLSDGVTETKKEHTKKLMAVSVDEEYVACLLQKGPIEVYKMMYKQRSKARIAVDKMLRNESSVLSIEYYGTIPVQDGHYLSIEICSSFSSIFTIHKVENKSVVSVWDLHSHHIRSMCSIDGIMESCGVLKNIGELIVAEKWNGEQVRYEKQWIIKKRETKKKKYFGKCLVEENEQIMAKVSINAKLQLSKYIGQNQFVHSGVISMTCDPGMGIQTLAMIRNDSKIVLFETMSLTVMRILEVICGHGFRLRELRYDEENTLIAIYKENRALRKRNKELYKNLGCAPPTRTWRFKPK